jgi:MFS family permease
VPGRLFTPRFFVMCGFSFTVFLSAFQLLPTAPYHIIDLGGSTFASGLFLGFLTYSSAISAPFTGALADRIGQPRMLMICSLSLVGFSMAYAVITDVRLLLTLVLVHGVFWSGLLSASAAYMTNLLPESRRAEGIGYWGVATLPAIAVAPAVGFWIYRRGWLWICVATAALNLVMAAIASMLKEGESSAHSAAPGRSHGLETSRQKGLLEWRVLVISITLALYSFGYGGITSFTSMYADAIGVHPRSLYLSTLAVAMLLTRPILGRLADVWGHKRIFIPCLVFIACGMACLAIGGTRGWMLLSAVIFGVGFGTAYPSYVGYVMQGVSAARRGAAFGAVLAAFDTGIGTGSTAMGWLIQRFGFSAAFAVAAGLAGLALPYFLVVDRLYGRSRR